MVDIFKRIVVTLIWLCMIVYIISFMVNGEIIVIWEIVNNNMMISILLLILTAFFTAVYWIYPITIKRHKTTLLILWLFLVVFWKQYLLNDASNWIYIWDFTILFWVFIILFGATWVLITNNIKKKENSKNIEIIEV